MVMLLNRTTNRKEVKTRTMTTPVSTNGLCFAIILLFGSSPSSCFNDRTAAVLPRSELPTSPPFFPRRTVVPISPTSLTTLGDLASTHEYCCGRKCLNPKFKADLTPHIATSCRPLQAHTPPFTAPGVQIEDNGAHKIIYGNENYKLQVGFPGNYPMEAPQMLVQMRTIIEIENGGNIYGHLVVLTRMHNFRTARHWYLREPPEAAKSSIETGLLVRKNSPFLFGSSSSVSPLVSPELSVASSRSSSSITEILKSVSPVNLTSSVFSSGGGSSAVQSTIPARHKGQGLICFKFTQTNRTTTHDYPTVVPEFHSGYSVYYRRLKTGGPDVPDGVIKNIVI
ncbi:hypothetical protein LXL04_038592 [Taraxacum kok-saghyz]